MKAILIGILFAGLAIWLIVSRIKRRRRPAQEAVDDVVRWLNSPRSDGKSEVVLDHALPLSHHMVKEVGRQHGYRFVSEISRHSNDTFVFEPRNAKIERPSHE